MPIATKAQRTAFFRLYVRALNSENMANVPRSYRAFRKTIFVAKDYAGVTLWGMFFGIEPDGYTHT